MSTTTIMSGLIDSQVQMFIQLQSALQQCDPEIQQVVMDMVSICSSEDASEDEKKAAAYTIRDAIFPGLAEDMCDLERKQLETPEAIETQAKFELQESTFADRLKSAMSVARMTQEDLAKKTGVSQPAISQMLNRESRPQQRTIGKFAEALGIDPKELWPS